MLESPKGLSMISVEKPFRPPRVAEIAANAYFFEVPLLSSLLFGQPFFVTLRFLTIDDELGTIGRVENSHLSPPQNRRLQ